MRSQVGRRLPKVLRSAGFILLSLALSVAAAAQTRRPLSVERIYGQPSLSGALLSPLQWSPDGKWLSYPERSGSGPDTRIAIRAFDVATGERRLLLDPAKLPSLPASPKEASLTTSQQTGLGRLTPQQHFWAPGSDALLFVSQGSLFWFDLKTQSARRLTSAGTPVLDPKISPDGRWVSFVRDHDLYVVEVATGREKRLTRGGSEEAMNGRLDWVYPEEFDLKTAYWWSPDSSRIAYLHLDERRVTRYPLVNFLTPTGETEWMRYPKAGDPNPVARVGVVRVKDAKTRWMETGSDPDVYLPRVDWLRDSKRVAIHRLNRAQASLELLVADAERGKAQVVLSEQDPHWINLHDALYFFRDGERFLWSSEREGYRHLYLYDLSGRLLRPLTAGPWEVTQVHAVDESRGLLYFTATEKSPLERHYYRVSIEGGAITRLTREEGSHGVLAAPDGRHFVDNYSNAMTPTRQDVYRADGTHAAVLNENRVAELGDYNLQPVEFLKLRGADGTELNAMMIKPPDFDASRTYPVLVYTYSGPGAQIVRKMWGGSNFLWHQLMAQKGYIIFGLDNRGTPGRGRVFQSAIHRRFGEAELADQLVGVNYLKSLPYVDGARIGMWGWSQGGYLTCYAMLNAPDVFKAGFAGAPVTDWRQYDSIYTERYMGRPQDNPEGYKRSSPVHQAAQLKGKLLVAHGTGDDNVHVANSLQLVEELLKAGKYAEVLIYPGRGHGISDPTARVHLYRRVTQFFLDAL